jgi:hypothetical protein
MKKNDNPLREGQLRQWISITSYDLNLESPFLVVDASSSQAKIKVMSYTGEFQVFWRDFVESLSDIIE